MAILTLLFGRDVLATYEMDRDLFTVGRATECDIIIDNLNVSRHHCRIVKRDGLFYIEDLKSNNGTFLNGQSVTEQALSFGDEIGVGKHTLRFDSHSRLAHRGESTAPIHQPVMGTEDSGTVVVNVQQLAALQEQASAVRRAHLRVSGTDSREPIVELTKGEMRIGRHPDSDVRVPGLFVGRTQCIISRRENGYYLEHVGGLRMTRVNGERAPRRELAGGDVIEVAGARLTFYDDSARA